MLEVCPRNHGEPVIPYSKMQFSRLGCEGDHLEMNPRSFFTEPAVFHPHSMSGLPISPTHSSLPGLHFSCWWGAQLHRDTHSSLTGRPANVRQIPRETNCSKQNSGSFVTCDMCFWFPQVLLLMFNWPCSTLSFENCRSAPSAPRLIRSLKTTFDPSAGFLSLGGSG